jgi:hypothetical protein
VEKFLRKYFAQNQLDVSEITGFLAEFCEKKGKSPTGQQLSALVQLLQLRQLNLHTICIEACELENLQLYTIYNVEGGVICYKLEKNGEVKEESNS